jgi:phosphoglycerate dehydrogenase-like enzyme
MDKPAPDALAKAEAEAAAAIKEYEFSRERYMSTLKNQAEEKIVGTARKRREALMKEVDNLLTVGKFRAEAKNVAIKAYAQRCPGKVTASGMQPPNPADRMTFSGAEKLYRAALKASEEFNEVNDLLKKRRDLIEQIDAEAREVLRKHHDDLVRALESPGGFEAACRRDPLLGRAHARMKAAMAQRDALAGRPAAETAAT